MSGDESFLLYSSFGLSVLLAFWWYRRIFLSRQANAATRELLPLALAPILAALGVFLVIANYGSFDVRDASDYLLMYTFLGIVWFLGAAFAMELLGISFRDDAVERRNPAAAFVVISAMMAHAAIYAGGNIGNGPGWWTVVIAAGIGSGAWVILWALLQFCCGIAEDITVERDVPAGIRLSGYALAMGLICARGAAGDWTSLHQTFAEFIVAWPSLPLTAVAIAVERVLDLQPEHYRRGANAAVIIAAIYVVAGVGAVNFAGPLPHNPQYDKASAASP